MIIKMDEAYKSFTKEEHLRHLEKIQKELERMDLDGVLLTTPENIYYSTGYRSWYTSSLFRPVYVLVPRVGDPAIVLRILEKSTVKFTSWVENIYVSGTASRNIGQIDAETHEEAVLQAINDIMPNAKKIGLEMDAGLQHYWSLNVLKNIIEMNESIQFVDGSLAIQRARMKKTSWEIEKLRTVACVTEKAILETFAQIVPGVTTEKDISRSIASKMTSRGVDKISYLTVSSGIQKYTTINSYATDRVVQFGENIIVDISGHIDGYASDLTRMMHLGKEVPLDYQEMADISSESVRLGKEKMKPNETVASCSVAIEDYIRSSKYGDFLIHSSGHGVGLSVVEYPMIENSNTMFLEEGMVFAVENGVYPFDKEDGAENLHLSFRMEDIVVVTASGSEWLSGPGKSIYCLSDFIK